MRRFASAAVMIAIVMSIGPGYGVHFYRGPGGGCTPADGEVGEQPASGPLGATVMLMHNTYNDTDTLAPVTRIKAGESVRWTWNSAHCHSVRSNDAGIFYSGFHYPTTEPDSPHVLPGFFDYPVPELEPTLSYTRTFVSPGTFTYACEHHVAIGMSGVVIVE